MKKTAWSLFFFLVCVFILIEESFIFIIKFFYSKWKNKWLIKWTVQEWIVVSNEVFLFFTWIFCLDIMFFFGKKVINLLMFFCICDKQEKHALSLFVWLLWATIIASEYKGWCIQFFILLFFRYRFALL